VSEAHGWQPGQYLKFDRERLQPAIDLIARIDLAGAAEIVDLGCGPGNVTPLLMARFPGARVTGVDASPAMLEKAAAAFAGAGEVDWVEADIAAWTPAVAPDLIFSNAALHWLSDHATLFPRLLAMLAPGGVLAAQMPQNFRAPTHQCIREAAEPWADRLAGTIPGFPVAAPADYLAWLEPHAASVELWETTYYHLLTGTDPVVQWTRGSILKPLLDAFGGDAAARAAFLADYAARLRTAYPPDAQGRTLLPFRRFFLLARKSG
jgi:trans-aconitate 2-methyltransferase